MSAAVTAQADHKGTIHLAPADCVAKWDGGAFLTSDEVGAAILAGSSVHACDAWRATFRYSDGTESVESHYVSEHRPY